LKQGKTYETFVQARISREDYPVLKECRLNSASRRKNFSGNVIQRLLFAFFTLFLPAAGNRNNNDGSLNNVGTNGNYWSSTVNGTNARNLNFNSGNVNVNNNNRANGFSCRCVSELNTYKRFFYELFAT